MTRERIVVVGASLAGLRTVEGLRRHGCEAQIILVGDETEVPYDRPPLSKDILLGAAEPEAVRLTSDQALTDLDVELRLGTRAVGLDVGARRLGLPDGDLEFDTLVIATGSSPRMLPGLPDLAGVHVLRTLDDALAIRRALEAAPRVVVVGGGFVGAEVASTARARGLDVTVVDTLPVLMQRGFGTVVGARVTEMHRAAGVGLRLEAFVAGLVGSERVEGIRLTDGSVVPADLVVIGIGTEPNTHWLAGSGLALGDGVMCDQHLCAAPGVFAVGDVARWAHPRYPEAVRAEHWTAAVEHAHAVSATLTGTPTVCAAVPYVWSDQHGHKLQIAGRLLPADELTWIVDEPDRFLVLAGSGGEQHAAFALNAPGQLIRQRMRLSGPAPWPPGEG
jgi:NADPH-dependent 2,4-dienoyl-CoA reductase/sulfur reductase-like enzyme